MPRLRDESTTADPRLDRLVQLDERSRGYALRAADRPSRDKVWRLDRSRMGDQGNEGACVEYGLSHVIACLPISVPQPLLARIRLEHLIYWTAQGMTRPWTPAGWTGDPWAGGSYPGANPNYEGTSELAGIKVLQLLGFVTGYHWAFNIDDAVGGVMWEGPANLGLNWTRGMSRPRWDGLAEDDGEVIGGHDVAWIGVQWGWRAPSDGRDGPKRDVAVIAQSWGLDQGDRGRIYVPLIDVERRLADDGTCAFLRGEKTVTSLP